MSKPRILLFRNRRNRSPLLMDFHDAVLASDHFDAREWPRSGDEFYDSSVEPLGEVVEAVFGTEIPDVVMTGFDHIPSVLNDWSMANQPWCPPSMGYMKKHGIKYVADFGDPFAVHKGNHIMRQKSGVPVDLVICRTSALFDEAMVEARKRYPLVYTDSVVAWRLCLGESLALQIRLRTEPIYGLINIPLNNLLRECIGGHHEPSD